MPLNYAIKADGGDIQLSLSGDFTFSENLTFRKVTEELSSSAPKVLTIDLSGVTAVDSAALSMLMVLRDRVGKERCEIRLVRSPPQVARILEVVDFGKIFTIVT